MTEARFRPRPGAAPLVSMLLAQAALEFRLTVRNGEQVVLTIIIPALLLLIFGSGHLASEGAPDLDFLVPGVMALAILSTAFTGQAIATGFDRRAGVLKRLSASPLPRAGLIAAKAIAVLGIELMQLLLIAGIGHLQGWRPAFSALDAVLMVVLGTAALSGLGLLMAGRLRAEATLAAANFVFLMLLAGGGMLLPLSKFPSQAGRFLSFLPTAALSDGLRAAFSASSPFPAPAVGILLVWAVVAITAAALTFRWE
ncbi:MAG: ABC transporter permease [Candidatus Dormibacteraceae bacterium]